MPFKKIINDKPDSVIEWVAIAPCNDYFYIKYNYLQKPESYYELRFLAPLLNGCLENDQIDFKENIVKEHSRQRNLLDYLGKQKSYDRLGKMSEKEKLKIHEENLSDLPARQVLPWYILPDYLTKLTSVAETLIGHLKGLHSNLIVCGLGQSPAWVIKSANYLPHDGIEFGDNIPFSGAFMNTKRYDPNPSSDKLYLPREGVIITKEAIKAYRNTLDSLGLNPAKIASEYRDNDIKFAIVDYVSSGNSLASFLKMMFSWAREFSDITNSLFNQAFTVINMHDSASRYPKIEKISFEEAAIDCYPIIITDVNSALDYFLHKLGKGVDKGQASERLVKSYGYSKWHESPKLTVENPEFIAFVESKVAKASLTRLMQLHSDTAESKDGSEPQALIIGADDSECADYWFSNT